MHKLGGQDAHPTGVVPGVQQSGQNLRTRAPRIAKAPGLRWKIWSIDEGNKEASGFYLFEDEKSLNNYVENIFNVGMKNNPAISNIVVKKFNILEDATIVTRSPISQLK